ncbi:MAG TPA: DotU family type IV/VI secretion system protein, partial [Polyangiaceae bacterium]|nr:DotU family type IV/VI secretion system protein [Polyangiaceae bacterium]
MSEALYWACAEALFAAASLGADGGDLPPPTEIRNAMLGVLQRMIANCRSAAVSDQDIAEAHYAVVAFIDERLLKLNWNGRNQWIAAPLQLHFFHEVNAGVNFFVRLRALLDRQPPSPAVEVYYLCLALGFMGASEGRAGVENAQGYMNAARARLGPLDPGTALGPHALPPDHYSKVAPRRPLVVVLSLFCALVVGLGIGLLRWSLNGALDTGKADIAGTASSNAAP